MPNYANVYQPHGSIDHFGKLRDAQEDARKALDDDPSLDYVQTFTSKNNELLEIVGLTSREPITEEHYA